MKAFAASRRRGRVIRNDEPDDEDIHMGEVDSGAAGKSRLIDRRDVLLTSLGMQTQL